MEYTCVNCGNVVSMKGSPLDVVAELPNIADCKESCPHPDYKLADEFLQTETPSA